MTISSMICQYLLHLLPRLQPEGRPQADHSVIDYTGKRFGTKQEIKTENKT